MGCDESSTINPRLVHPNLYPEKLGDLTSSFEDVQAVSSS
jgi:hypothetical protein